VKTVAYNVSPRAKRVLNAKPLLQSKARRA